MKTSIAALSLILAAIAPEWSIAADITSTFDTTDDSWKVIVIPDGGPYTTVVFGPLTPTLSRTGGNPGGHIFSADPQGLDGTFYFDAPARFLGDQSSSYGRALLYDVKSSGGGQEFTEADVVLVGRNGIVLVINTGISPATDWKTRAVLLHESAGWRIGGLSGTPPSKTQFMSVISDLSVLRIRGDLIFGTEITYLDNVVLQSARTEVPTTQMGIRVSAIEVFWNSIPNHKYVVQWRTDIGISTWLDLGPSVLGTGSTMRVTDQIPDGSPRRFYRVVEIP